MAYSKIGNHITDTIVGGGGIYGSGSGWIKNGSSDIITATEDFDYIVIFYQYCNNFGMDSNSIIMGPNQTMYLFVGPVGSELGTYSMTSTNNQLTLYGRINSSTSNSFTINVIMFKKAN